MAISLEIPKRLQATGIRRRDPPAIPEAPQAEIAATTLRTKAVAKSTGIPRVFTAARVKTLIGNRCPCHVDSRTKWDRNRIGIWIESKVMAKFHVDRDVSRRTTSEEGCYTADTQTFPNERIRISLHKEEGN